LSILVQHNQALKHKTKREIIENVVRINDDDDDIMVPIIE